MAYGGFGAAESGLMITTSVFQISDWSRSIFVSKRWDQSIAYMIVCMAQLNLAINNKHPAPATCDTCRFKTGRITLAQMASMPHMIGTEGLIMFEVPRAETSSCAHPSLRVMRYIDTSSGQCVNNVERTN